jgi:hypothetical protein
MTPRKRKKREKKEKRKNAFGSGPKFSLLPERGGWAF